MTDPQFPRGKINPTDEGVLHIAVFEQHGEVVLDFGKMISWIGMAPDQAEQIGQMLIERARIIRSGT